MNRQSILITVFISLTCITSHSFLADEVAEGFFGGGFLGAAIGGAAGGPRGAGIGGAVGSVVGAGMGAAARSKRERAYYDYRQADIIYEQNDELRYTNKHLIRQHKRLFQQQARYEWMLKQCRRGKMNYRKRAEELFFEDDIDYDTYLYWQRRSNIRTQNRLLARANNKLRSINAQMKDDIRNLKRALRNCEDRMMP